MPKSRSLPPFDAMAFKRLAGSPDRFVWFVDQWDSAGFGPLKSNPSEFLEIPRWNSHIEHFAPTVPNGEKAKGTANLAT